jgi:hypothetical protein
VPHYSKMYYPHIGNESTGGKTDINIQSNGEQTDFVISLIYGDFTLFQLGEISLFLLDNDKVDGVETCRILNRIDQQENKSCTNKLTLSIDYQGSKRATFSWPSPARVFVKPARPDSTLVQPDLAQPDDYRGPPGPGPRDFHLQRFFPSRIRRSLRYNYQCSWEQIISAITNMVRLYCRS